MKNISSILFIIAIAVFTAFKKYQPADADLYIVTTLAGDGENRWVDGVGNKASLSGELGNITVDAAGNVYVMDFTNLRKITPDGTVTTVFGSMVYDTDGNPKEIGQELQKGGKGIVVDAGGTIYVSEKFGKAINKIVNEKSVQHFAGNSEYSGTDDGDLKSAEFKEPKDMCIDKTGNIYLVDGFYKVRKISGTKVSSLAGDNDNGGDYKPVTGKSASFKDIGGIAVDSKGNVYVSQPDINCILKISPGGTSSHFAGEVNPIGLTKDGTGKAARFMRPGAIACDAADNIYVADHRKIRKISPAGVVTTIAGASKDGESVGGFRDAEGSKALFGSFDGIACDAMGNIYVSDIGNRRIRKISKQ